MSVKPEADENDPFGQWLFPYERNLSVYEKNTKEEDDLWWALERHYTSNAILNATIVEKLVELDRAGKYQSYLHVPADQNVYRGMRTFGEDRESFLYGMWSENELIALRNGELTSLSVDQIVLNPQRGVMSWSKRESISALFANRGEERYRLIFQAPVAGNTFVINPDEGNKISFSYYNYNELETLSLGPVKCSRVICQWKRF